MEEMDHETSMNIDVEGPSTPVNVYGSPVAPHGRRNEGSVASTTHFVPLPLVNVNRVTCSCKNLCSHKKTAKTPGCPCKNALMKCSSSCTCETKRTACKNKRVEVVVNRNLSAFSRHQEQAATAEREIQDFIKSLAMDEKYQILLRLLSQGRCSLDYAMNIRAEISDSAEPDCGPDRDDDVPEWCDCSVYRPLPLDMENVCCNKRTCVTSYTMYQNIQARFDILAEEPDYSTNSFRKAAYRQYCLWKLGKGNQRVLPSCVVLTIRRFYPAPDGIYMGYRQS